MLLLHPTSAVTAVLVQQSNSKRSHSVPCSQLMLYACTEQCVPEVLKGSRGVLKVPVLTQDFAHA